VTEASRGVLLVVEDSDEDFESLRWAFRKLDIDRTMVRARDAEEAVEYLRDGRRRPFLVLLDLNLTVADGRAVLARVKGDADLRAIPVVIWTTSANPGDVRSCYREGANTYLRKPFDTQELLDTVRTLEHYWHDLALTDCEG
jgi:CheY-like chemotaxis protein